MLSCAGLLFEGLTWTRLKALHRITRQPVFSSAIWRAAWRSFSKWLGASSSTTARRRRPRWPRPPLSCGRRLNAVLARSDPGQGGWQVARVRTFIDKNLHRTIHTQDLSAEARRTPAHFSRSFKLSFGEPPHAYVVKRRLEKACHLMITGSASLSEIALSVGFSDQAHLCRLFRQAFGQSPANWRREHETQQ
ncbi:AraC-like DNA-binding protein [Bradyrhizobium sp. AZCC 2262]|uniref:helix-turn-helix domain-containing protein n=1 Tax=Bradyrhizobium sp. AZCC 2262 TaxID=3117022 RepID=UPI00302FFE8A